MYNLNNYRHSDRARGKFCSRFGYKFKYFLYFVFEVFLVRIVSCTYCDWIAHGFFRHCLFDILLVFGIFLSELNDHRQFCIFDWKRMLW